MEPKTGATKSETGENAAYWLRTAFRARGQAIKARAAGDEYAAWVYGTKLAYARGMAATLKRERA